MLIFLNAQCFAHTCIYFSGALSWLFLCFPTFGYLIEYLTESKELSRGPTENYRLENAITQPFAEINTGVVLLSTILSK